MAEQKPSATRVVKDIEVTAKDIVNRIANNSSSENEDNASNSPGRKYNYNSSKPVISKLISGMDVLEEKVEIRSPSPSAGSAAQISSEEEINRNQSRKGSINVRKLSSTASAEQKAIEQLLEAVQVCFSSIL